MINNQEPANRDETGKFKKGKSGNPNGRPKVPPDVKEMLKASCPAAAALLIEKMNCSADEKLQVECAKTIIERVYGKPTQPLEGDLTGGLLVTLSSELLKYAE